MGVNKIDQSLSHNQPLPTMEFVYTNWKGETLSRKVQDPVVWFGESKYHTGAQWFIHAFDIQKQEFRDFAVADILTFIDNKGE